MHLLWKYDRKPCDSAECVRCCLAGRRPPQAWRYDGTIGRSLKNLDALIFPSEHALREHQKSRESANLWSFCPYFLPDDWSNGIEQEAVPVQGRPYIAAAGRLVRMKGFQRLIPIMKQLPEIDLKIAGTGPFEGRLRALAAGMENVEFLGLLGGEPLARLFHGARAVVVPSLFAETFGYVVLEAFAVKTPVVVHQGGGAIEETGVASGGGLGYDTDEQLLEAIRSIVHDPCLREKLAGAGHAMRQGAWSENAHMQRYFELIETARASRTTSTPRFDMARRRLSIPTG